MLFNLPALTLDEQREERRNTINERCEEVAKYVNGKNPAIVWCHLNAEGDLLEKIIPNAKQVRGSNTDEEKEEIFLAFTKGELPVLVTKPKIGAWGMNWQHCSEMVMFPSHSFESYYQSIRRCWRFGQTKSVNVRIVTTDGEAGVVGNMRRKSDAADKMFDMIVAEMKNILQIKRSEERTLEMQIPGWLA